MTAAGVKVDAGPSRAAIVCAALEWVDTPYVHQASAKGAGTDCLGVLRGLWREFYGAEPEAPPPYTPDWGERRNDEPLLAAARRNLCPVPIAGAAPGDVLLFRVAPRGPAKHVGILTANDRFVHAYAGHRVVESWLTRWWRARIVSTFAFPGAH